jgi:hypothetical protein
VANTFDYLFVEILVEVYFKVFNDSFAIVLIEECFIKSF